MAARRGGLAVGIRVDAGDALDGLKAARRDLNREVKAGLLEAGQKAFVPRVRDRVKHDRTTRAVATSSVVAIERRGPDAGLQEFGGTVRAPIRAKKGSAINTPRGPRAEVRGPRVYRAMEPIRRGIEAGLDRGGLDLIAEAAARPFRKYLEGR